MGSRPIISRRACGTLDRKIVALLSEWDFERNRSRYLSLRDKLLYYPRIAKELDHPPFDETNCEELAFVLSQKDLRDALVHASPIYIAGPPEINKLSVILNLRFGNAERLVDSIISLVRKIEKAVRGDTSGLFWLIDRGADGFFPEAVFD